jgi:hypothetical protein
MHLYSLSRRTYPCIISLFFYMFDYTVLDSGYREASGYVGGFDLGDA